MGGPNKWVSLRPGGCLFFFWPWLSWITIIWCRWLSHAIITHCQEQREPVWASCRPWAQGPVLVQQLAGFCLFPTLIYDFQRCLIWLFVSTCALGVGGEGWEERRAEQEDWDSSVILAGRTEWEYGQWRREEGAMRWQFLPSLLIVEAENPN